MKAAGTRNMWFFLLGLTWNQCDPVEGMEGEEASLYLKSAIGKLVPEHCTTIPKAALQKIFGLRKIIA